MDAATERSDHTGLVQAKRPPEGGLPVALSFEIRLRPQPADRAPRGQAVLLRGRDAPILRGTVYVTVGGRLLALAEVDHGEIVPKRVFNLAGLTSSAGSQEGH